LIYATLLNAAMSDEHLTDEGKQPDASVNHGLVLWTLGGLAVGCFILGPIIGGPGDHFAQFVGALIGGSVGVVVAIITAPDRP
jgi:sorbitol-specific phosphotransferase system component IIBC